MSSLPPYYAFAVRSLYRSLFKEAKIFFDEHSRAYLRKWIRRQFREQNTLTGAREFLDLLRCANANEVSSCRKILEKAWGRKGEIREFLIIPLRAHGGLPLETLVNAQFLERHRKFQPDGGREYSSVNLRKEEWKHQRKMMDSLLPPMPYVWRAKLERLAAGEEADNSVPEHVRMSRLELYRRLLDETPVFVTRDTGDGESEAPDTPLTEGCADKPPKVAPGPPANGIEPADRSTVKFKKRWNVFPEHVIPFIPGRPQGEAVAVGIAVLEETVALGPRLAVARSLLSNAGVTAESRQRVGPLHTWGLGLENEDEGENPTYDKSKKKKKIYKKRVKPGRFTKAEGLGFAERAVV